MDLSTLEKVMWGFELRAGGSPAAASAERPARPVGQNFAESAAAAPGRGGGETT